MEQIVADPYRRAFNWYDGRMGENPLDAIERRETREEMLADMSEKQRECELKLQAAAPEPFSDGGHAVEWCLKQLG